MTDVAETIQQIDQAAQSVSNIGYYAKSVGVVAQLPRWQQAVVGTSLVVTPGLALGALALRYYPIRFKGKDAAAATI